MKRFFGIFVLSAAEQRVVVFVVLLLVGAAWLKHYRDLNYEAGPRPSDAATPAVSPSPSEIR